MKQLLLGLGIFVAGVFFLSTYWRDYREKTSQAVREDVFDLMDGRGLGVVFAAIITVVGAAMLASALAPGEVFDYSKRFPFVTFSRPASPKP